MSSESSTRSLIEGYTAQELVGFWLEGKGVPYERFTREQIALLQQTARNNIGTVPVEKLGLLQTFLQKMKERLDLPETE